MLLLCAAHYATDGISVNLYSHELLSLLGGPSSESDSTPRTDAQLANLLEYEWSIRWGDSACSEVHPIPAPTEERIPRSKTRLESVARVVEFNKHQGNAIVCIIPVVPKFHRLRFLYDRVVTPFLASHRVRDAASARYLNTHPLKHAPSCPNAGNKASPSVMLSLLLSISHGSELCMRKSSARRVWTRCKNYP